MNEENEKKKVLLIEDCQISLKKLILNSMLANEPKDVIKQATILLMDDTSQSLKELGADEEFIIDFQKSLKLAFIEWYTIIEDRIAKAKQTVNEEIKKNANVEAKIEDASALIISPTQKQVPFAKGKITNLREYMTIIDEGSAGYYINYPSAIKSAINDITTELANGTLSLTTIDKNGHKRTKSIRNMAEIQTRYNLIADDIKRLGDTKFVVATSHANASERCSWWQGKIFIVDFDVANREMGEYKGQPTQTIVGYIDGKPYYSLKQACENGFLSYNCQHRLVKYYKGIHTQPMNMIEVKRRRNLSSAQRYMENKIRKYRSKAELELDTNKQKEYQNKVTDLYEDYAKFCDKENIPRYDWRTKI